MTATLIATTAMRDLQPLGTGGRLAINAAAALTALLQRTLGAEHAALFAEPHANAARGEIDWYAEGTGPAVPLADLPPDRSAPARELLQRLTDDIRAEIMRLRAAAGEGERFLAEMLDLALRIPDRGAIRVRDGRPVLVGWGHQRIGPAGVVVGAAVLGRMRAPPPTMVILPPPVVPPPAGPRLWPWTVALGCALVLLALAAGYGWSASGRPPAACRIDPAAPAALAAWRGVDARNAALRAELAAVLNEAGQRRLQCPPTAATAAPDPARAASRGGQAGRLQIILAWDDTNDLDLHVICPNGEELFFRNPHACGGTLDVDANSDASNTSDTPVENAFWPNPAAGAYQVVVAAFRMRTTPESHFRVTVRQEGQPDRVQEGVAAPGQTVAPVLTVSVPGGATP